MTGAGKQDGQAVDRGGGCRPAGYVVALRPPADHRAADRLRQGRPPRPHRRGRPGELRGRWAGGGQRLMAGRQGRRRFGAIRRLPSGRYQVRYRTADGRDVTAPMTFATKADAGRYLSKVEADLLRGEWADPRLGRTTFGEWADRWLDSTVNLRANTKAGYRSILRRYLRPAFQSYPLASIDVLAIRMWLARLE